MSLAEIVTAFKLQAEWCHKLGSPLYGDLLERASADLEAEGLIAKVISGWLGNPVPDALALRLMGAVHGLVLAGQAPDLARFYPSVGGTPVWPDVWDAFLRTVDQYLDEVRYELRRGVQTNEVNRCAALLGGFLYIAERTRLPLRILEVGASAGLNSSWDQYRYEYSRNDKTGFTWGEEDSPVLIRAAWEGPTPALRASIRVADRAACDIAPVDIRNPIEVRRIESFVWPDQVARLQQLRDAIHCVARRMSDAPERADVIDWLRRRLATPAQGVATVVYHSIFWWYLSHERRQAMNDSMHEAGNRARADAPLAWLQFEIRSAKGADVELILWPGGEKELLGRADPHGRNVTWFVPRPWTDS